MGDDPTHRGVQITRVHDPASTPAADELVGRLGHQFADRELLALALTHRSWCAENAGFSSNERLEFLGDAVLGMAVTDCIYRVYPHMPEGELAKLRATVVSAVTLSEIAADLGLGDVIRLGKGEDASGGREKASILADSLEAVVGAVYVDSGWDAATPFVLGLLGDRIAEAVEAGPGGYDYKTQLQELAARRFEELPAYTLTDEGPDHEKRFFAEVRIDESLYGHGEGRSKKQAEQAAAQAALDALTALDTIEEEVNASPAARVASTEDATEAVPPHRVDSGKVDA